MDEPLLVYVGRALQDLGEDLNVARTVDLLACLCEAAIAELDVIMQGRYEKKRKKGRAVTPTM